MIRTVCKGQRHKLQWNTAYRGLTDAQLPNITSPSLYRKPLKIIVSATVTAAAGSEPSPCHFTSSEAGSKARVANIPRESSLKLVVVGNLMNAPMPLFALICQTFSWYHCNSRRNEWSDHLGTAGLYAVCPHITAWGVPAAFPQAIALNNSSPPG